MADQDVKPWAGEADTWTIPSNSGWRQFKCARTNHALRGDAICCSLHIYGDFWDRNENESKSLVPDFRVDLPQVLISAERLRHLIEDVDRWLVDQENFERSISSPKSGQDFTVIVNREPSLVYSIGKRAVTFRYTNGEAMIGKWSFVVDESCLRICRDSLSGFLDGIFAS